jgi:predicted tellurium resistance membrane protein TerC
MLELLADPQNWIAFATLTALELVLGIDNVIFISILVDKLPPAQRELARKLGLFAAMFMRLGLLLVLAWIVGMTAPLISVAIRAAHQSVLRKRGCRSSASNGWAVLGIAG